MSMILIVLVFSGLPFVFIQCMPGKKTFALTSILYIAFVIYGYYDVKKADGPGGALAYAFFYLIAYGAAAGIITKAITLYMASRNITLKKRTAVRLVGLFLIPCFVYMPVVLNKWKQRSPSSACNYDMVTFSVSDQKFRVPGIGIVTANTGNGKPTELSKNMDNFYSFIGAMSYRKFCHQFNNGGTPAEVNAINFNLIEIARQKNDPRFAKLCAQAKWPTAICNYSGYATPDGYPASIGIYNKTTFSPGFMGGGWDYMRIKDEMAKATMPSDIPDFSFDGHNYFWIDKDAKIGTIPYALSCYKSGKEFYCRSDELWAGNVYITYGAKVSLTNPLADARSVRQTTIDFIKSLNVR